MTRKDTAGSGRPRTTNQSSRRPRPLNSDDLGAKGESRFGELCHDAGLKPNRSDRDRVGWDYVVTWPLDETSPLDTRPAPLACHVQLKTVWAGNARISLNLATLEYIVKDSRPAFILVLEVADDATLAVTGMHLLPITDAFLGEILKRLRQARAQGKAKPPAKFQLDFTKWGKRLPHPTGAEFRRAVEDHVPDGMAAYAHRKEKQLAELGYESGHFSLRTILQVGSQEEVIDGFLGLKPLRVLSAEHFDTRFGIDIPLGSWERADATLEVTPRAISRAMLVVTRDRDGSQLTFTGALYVPPSKVVGAGIAIFEFRTTLFRIRISLDERSGRADSRISFHTGKLDTERETAAGWRDFYTLLAWAGSGDVAFDLRPAKRKLPPLQAVSKIKAEGPDSERMEHFARAADLVDWVMLRAEAPGTKLGAEELFAAVDDLRIIKAIEQRPDEVTPLSFTTRQTTELPPEFETEMLYMNRVPIGPIEIAYAARTRVHSSSSDGVTTWTSGALQLAYVRKIKAGDASFRRFAGKARHITGVKSWFGPTETQLPPTTE